MHGWLERWLHHIIKPKCLGTQLSPGQLPIIYMDCMRHYLNADIVDKIEDLEDWEKSINVGIISSQDCQYSRKATDFQCPWTMMMKGSTPMRNKWVVPTIWKLWPVNGKRSLDSQISLHLEIHHGLLIGKKQPSAVLNANRCPDGGALLLIHMWLVKAHCMLQLQPESIHIINLPCSLVFVWGAQNEWNRMFETIRPDFWGVLHGAWIVVSKVWSTQTLPMWHWHQKAMIATATQLHQRCHSSVV